MKKRLISLLLALALLPTALFCASAEGTETAEEETGILWAEDFEDYAEGDKVSVEDGYLEVPYVQAVILSERGKHLRFPLVASDPANPKVTPTNIGKYFRLPHASLSTTEKTSIKASFYPHADKGTNPNIGVWIQNYSYVDLTGATKTHKWIRFADVDLKTGDVTFDGISGVKTGAPAMTPDAWNTMEFIFDPRDGSYEIYVNEALYATCAAPVVGVSFSIGAGNVILVNNGTNNPDGVTKDSDADATFSNTNYLDTDNWCIRTLAAEEDAEGGALDYHRDFDTETVGEMPIVPMGSSTFDDLGRVAEEADGNRYWLLPYSGEASSKGKVNVNKNAYIDNPMLHYANTPTVDFTASYYIPEGETGIVEARFATAYCTFLRADGSETAGQKIAWLDLWKLDYSAAGDEMVLLPGAANTGDTARVKKGGWIELSATVDMVNGVYTIFADGEAVITNARLIPQYKDSVWIHGVGLKNLVIPANATIILSPHSQNRTDVDTAVGIDGISITETASVTVTVDGEERVLPNRSPILLSVPKEKTFLYAEVTDGEGETTLSYSPTVVARDGISIVSHAIEFSAMTPMLRADEVTGIRFLSKLSTADYEALKASAAVESVEMGTTVVPNLYKGVSPDVLHPEALKGLKLLHFPLENDAFYTGISEEGYSLLAASIVSIKESNYNLGFSGVGYLRVTMKDGTVRTLYTSSAVEAKSVTVASLAKSAILSGFLSEETAELLSPIASAHTTDLTALMQRELADLNVLAMGDSTFFGDSYAWEWQWINWMARDCDWALTNLAQGGESISYRATQNQTSTVHRLFNESEYRFGGSNSSSSPYRYSNEKALGRNAEDVDLILITAGHNDFGGASIYAPRGELTLENRDTSTYVGAWNVVLEELLVRYPNAKIVIVNQWYLTNTSSNRADTLTRHEFTDSVAEMYRKFYWENDRIHLLDAGDPRISNVHMTDPAFREQYSRNPGDIFHLNPDGMKIMKDAMLPYLWNLALRDQKAENAE